MDLDSIIYHGGGAVTPLRGDLLIAEPLLQEVYFKRSVVMILEQDSEKGYIGLALNKLTEFTLNDLIPEWEGGSRVPLYCGGPVDTDRLFVLHKLPGVFGESLEIVKGIYVGADMDTLKDYIDAGGETEGLIRFYIGYSGWMEGQLESELLKNVWALKRTKDGENLLEGYGDPYWRREVESMGPDYRSWLVVPESPWLN